MAKSYQYPLNYRFSVQVESYQCAEQTNNQMGSWTCVPMKDLVCFFHEQEMYICTVYNFKNIARGIHEVDKLNRISFQAS